VGDVVECPVCYDYMPLVDDGTEQSTQCRECGAWYWLTYDAEHETDAGDGHWTGTWTMAAMDPPDWDEVKGCVRYHEGRDG
jgi:hypothetical protein